MTENALNENLNRHAKMVVHMRGKQGKLRFQVVTKAWRRVFGRVEYKVTPFTGEGEAWVSSTNIEIEL
jgi:hypothetical protein